MNKLDLSLIVKKNVLLGSCPSCGTPASLVRMKQKKKISRLKNFFGFKMYHCSDCKWDGYIFFYKFSRNIIKVIGNYAIIFFGIIILAFFLSKVLRIYVK